MQEIPVYLVSGFMDSGKTTLIEDTLYNQGFEGNNMVGGTNWSLNIVNVSDIELNNDVIKAVNNKINFNTENIVFIKKLKKSYF